MGVVRWAFMVVAVLVWSGPVAGQDAPSRDEDGDGSETIVVTAERMEQKRFEALRSIEVVGRERILERQARSVPELIEEVPGVFLQQTNRGAGAPLVRGLVGPQNLIVVDGIRFNTSIYRTGPNQYLALLHPFFLDKLEVVRGPSSVLYGNGAMGGVMQVITRAPVLPDPGGVSGRARAGISTADLSHAGSMEMTTGGQNLLAVAGLSLNTFDTLRAGGGSDQPISDYSSFYWHGKVVYAPTGTWSLTGTYLGAAIRDAGRADQLGLGDLRFYDNDEHLAYLLFRYDGDVLKRVRASVSYQRLTEHVDRYSCRLDDASTVGDPAGCVRLDPDQLTRMRRYSDGLHVLGADVRVGTDLLEDRVRLNLGLETYHDIVGSSLDEASAEDEFVFERRERGNYSDPSSYLSLGAYLHGDAVVLELGEGAGELRVSGGLRYSHFGARADDVPVIGDVDYAFDGLVGSAGIQWLLPGLASVYFNWVEGFRAPNLEETTVLGDTGSRFEVPNPELGPERADTLELGTRLNLDPLELFVSYNYTLVGDVITQEPSTWEGQGTREGKPVTRLVNGDEGVFQGLELSARLFFGNFTARAAVTWTQGDVTTGEGTTGARRVPPIFGMAALRYDDREEGLYAEVFSRWALRQDRLHPTDRLDLRMCATKTHPGVLRDPCDGTPGWITLNLRTGWRSRSGFRLDLLLANLTDTRYRLHGSGFDMPGFDVRTTATWRF